MNEKNHNQVCQCSDITFGTLDEILSVSRHTSDCHTGFLQIFTHDMDARVRATTI